jgi:CBS-domain-containing membrane protein
MKKVKDIMTKTVISCPPGSELTEVSKLMKLYNCGFIPITNSANKLAGVITDRDICLTLSEPITDIRNFKVENIMKKDVQSCSPDDTMRKALDIMRTKGLRRLPVVDRQAELIGVVSLSDILLNSQTNSLDEDLYGVNPENMLESISETYKNRMSYEFLENN